uniref:Uncharacterized protein n=1 Tax=Arundo donax TaxID=35708 RepID=A0A0A9FRX5_ARUDO
MSANECKLPCCRLVLSIVETDYRWILLPLCMSQMR